MADGPYQPNLPYIADGEAVAAAVANRPIQTLGANDAYLKARLDAAALGAQVVAFDAPVSDAVLVDSPVAWNPSSGRFEPALAQAVVDGSTGFLVPGPVTDCVGVCIARGEITGDVLMAGRYATTLAGAAAATPAPAGRYYLSSATAGRLVRQRPPVSVPVLYYDGTYAYVAPVMREFYESHVHLRLALACAPAGQNTVVGDRHTVTAADADAPGWLPADHAGFAGAAPAGAAFGYNLAADPTALAHWPPVPLAGSVVVWDKGLDNSGGTVAPLGLNGLVQLDAAGIWWMSDCLGDVPWPADYDADSPPDAVSANSSAGAECPRLAEMRLYVAYTEMLFATDQAVVTSLRPADGSPITVTDRFGNPATGGDLAVGVDVAFLEDADADALGSVAFKELDGLTLRPGRLVEGLFAGGGVTLAADHTRAVGGDTLYQGRVTLSTDAALADRALSAVVISLDGVRDRFSDALGIPYLGMPSGRASRITAQFNVPAAGLPESPELVVRALVTGNVTGTLPALTLTVKLLPRPGSGAQLPMATPTPASPAFVTALAITAGSYREASAAGAAATAGATAYVTLTRAASDGYAGEVGILRVEAVLAAGA